VKKIDEERGKARISATAIVPGAPSVVETARVKLTP
jgi:hypothetical protein